MKEQIAAQCRKLRLSRTMAENAMTIKAPTHPEFLCKLLRQEVANRDEARKARLIKQAATALYWCKQNAMEA